MNRKETAVVGGGGEFEGLIYAHLTGGKSVCQGAADPGPLEALLRAAGAVGGEHQLSSKMCMRSLGISSERSFRWIVERERADGALILAGARGLFLPSDGVKGVSELRRYILTGESRIRGQARALRTARRLLRRLEVPGQLQFETPENETGCNDG